MITKDYDTLPEQSSLPAGLEEAAVQAHIQMEEGGEEMTFLNTFIAGAKWGRAKMMERAVGGRYMKADGKVYVESWMLDIDPDSVKAGDEVVLFIVPKEK